MQHETSFPARLGFDEYDVSNSYCEYVVERATRWLREAPPATVPADRGLLRDPPAVSAGPVRTRRPGAVDLPDYLPDTPDVREDLADFYGSITVADAAVGRTARHPRRDRTGPHDLGGVHDRPRPGPAPGQVDAVRRGHRDRDDRAATDAAAAPPAGCTTTCSAGWTWCPRCWTCWACRSPTTSTGLSHAANLLGCDSESTPVRGEVYTTKTYHDSFDPIRAIRTKEYSYIENYATRPLLDLPWTSRRARRAKRSRREPAPRPQRELYDLRADPTEQNNLLTGAVSEQAEAIADEMALLLNDWRQKTNDVIPSEFAGTRISARYTETYMQHQRIAASEPLRDGGRARYRRRRRHKQ